MIENLAAEADAAILAGQTVAILGYGNQGRSHALNLRDAGGTVIVGQRTGSPRHANALADGFEPLNIRDAAEAADLLIFGLPDEAAGEIYDTEIAPAIHTGHTLGFIHGFAIHYGLIKPPQDVDVILVAPKAQGRAVRRLFKEGTGLTALIAVHQDASGNARKSALGWAGGLGCRNGLVIQTTFAHETETDLFGEQAVLCGGLISLIKAAFETLVDAGYPPELAYFECCHEVKLLADLVHAGGVTYTRERISNTARFGDLTRGPRVVDDHVRNTLGEILNEIRSGAFAREWMNERNAGLPRFNDLTEADREHQIERVGRMLRAAMWGKSQPS